MEIIANLLTLLKQDSNPASLPSAVWNPQSGGSCRGKSLNTNKNIIFYLYTQSCEYVNDQDGRRRRAKVNERENEGDKTRKMLWACKSREVMEVKCMIGVTSMVTGDGWRVGWGGEPPALSGLVSCLLSSSPRQMSWDVTGWPGCREMMYPHLAGCWDRPLAGEPLPLAVCRWIHEWQRWRLVLAGRVQSLAVGMLEGF